MKRFVTVVGLFMLGSFALMPFTGVEPRQAAIVGLAVGVGAAVYDWLFGK